jgi:hypothetical protein
MLLSALLDALNALNFLGPVVEPVLWLVSPTFRARTRERWARSGRGLRIGEVGVWFAVWGVILVLCIFGAAAWLQASQSAQT